MAGVILGGSHINQAVSDDDFFKLMPEFGSIRAQLQTMKYDPKSNRGCSACNKRRMHASIDGNFAAIASRLPNDRAAVLKKYLGISEGQKFYIRAMDPVTRQLVLKEF